MNGLRLTTGLVLAVGLLSTPACADTVKLICGNGVYVRIDMDASTAGSVWGGAESLSQIQMYPATITADTVTWTAPTVSPPATMTLDRHSGVFTGSQSGQIYRSVTCKKDNQDILGN